ncbi:trichohyalin-like [Periplaneta americana]|uniref:trichohyalin-like n=1 Tax=Periplaneta americana TaxID=6978 RepID=UPI0037E8DE36
MRGFCINTRTFAWKIQVVFWKLQLRKTTTTSPLPEQHIYRATTEETLTMRKTRLKILPAHCLAHIGFLLLYLSCPILAEMSRGQPDRGLESSYQLQVLEHCASPPEDPGDGGCTNHRNVQTKMTRPDPPDNEHHATCSTSEVFKLENTCSMTQRPSDDSDGRPKPATRYARRLLAARSKDQSASTPKIYAPREVKYRSLKRHHVSEEVPKSVESQVSADRRTLSASRNSLTASRTSPERNSRSSERDVNRRTAERFLSRRVSTLDVTKRLAERQSPSRTTSERRSSERDVSRRIATERLSIRRTSTERTYANTDDTRRTSTERLHQKTIERRMSTVEISRRTSPERQSTRRTSLQRKLTESDGNRRLTERQSTHRIASERRMAESREMSVDSQSTRRTSPERRMTDHEISRRTQNERRSDIRFARRTMSAERVSVIPVSSRTSSERKDADIRVSDNPSSYRRQANYRNMEGQINRHSNERLNSERRSTSRKTLSEQRNASEQRSYRRNSLDNKRSYEERLSIRRISEIRHDAERRNAIRRTTRSVSPERRVYSQGSIDRRDSRTLSSERGHEIRSSTRISADRELLEIRLSRDRRSNEFRRNSITSKATERASLSRRQANIEQRSFRRNSLPESRTAERSRFSRSISESNLDSQSRNSIRRTIQSISPERTVSFQASIERRESHALSPARMSSLERVSNMRSRVVVERKLADARELPSYRRQKESRQVSVGTDRFQPNRRSNERLDSERQLSSRRNQVEERRISSQRSFKRNSLQETRNSVERRLTRSVSEARLGAEQRNTVRRTTRSVSPERRVSVDRRESRTMPPSNTRMSSERVSDVRSGKVAEKQLIDNRVLPDYHRKVESRRVSVITERTLPNRRSIERQSSERQFNSRRISTEERKLSGQRSHTRNSLREMYNSAERRLTRTISKTRIDAEQRSTVRRTTRSVSTESRISVDRRESRASSLSRAVMPTGRFSVSRSSNTDRKLNSRRMSLNDRKLSGQRSYRRNSLDELHNSAGRRLTRSISDTRLDVEQRNTIRRTTRSVSPESRISVDRRESTALSSARITSSQRVSDVRYKSTINDERKSVDISSYRRQTESRKASTTERSLANRRSSERLNSERQLHSIKNQFDERRVSDQRTYRRNSLNSAERRFTRSISETRLDSERRNTIRRTTRSVSPERRRSSEVALNHRGSRTAVRADRNRETRMTERLVSRRSNELGVTRRMTAENQSSRRITFERRSSFGMSTERLTVQKSLAAERRMSDLTASRRNSNERLSSRRTPVKLSETSRSERISTERRLGDLTLTRSSVERRSTSPARRMSTVPDESRRTSSERLAKIRSTFDRRSDTKLHRSLSSERRQTESGAVSLAGRRASERVMAQRSVSRLSQSEDRNLSELRSYRRNSLEGIRTSNERRSARTVSKTHFDSDTRNAIRRTTRSVSADRRYSMRLISQRSSPRLSEERRNMKQSRERLNSDRRIGSHQMRDVRLSLDNSISRAAADRKLSAERRNIINGKSTDRRERDERSKIKLSRDRSSTLSRNNRASEEQFSTRRDSRLATERALASRDSRRTSVVHLSFVRNTRLTERLSVARNSRRTSEVLESRRISGERLYNQRYDSRSMARRVSVRNLRSASTERLSNQRSITANDEIVTVRDSRISAHRLSDRRDSMHSSERLSSYRNAREAYTERLMLTRSSRTSVEHLSAIRNSRRVMNENRFVRQTLPNYTMARRTTTGAQRQIPTFQTISRKFDVRLASGHLLNNKASQQELEISQKQLVTADNTTLKTESLLGTGLSLETVKNTIGYLDLSQFMGKQNNWSANIYEYITNFLATLAVMWPALAICKGNMLESVENYDVASILSTKMEHLNSFFIDKPSSNYALVPDSLALFDSAKTSPRDGMLNAVIGGGATVAFMLLSTKTK